MKRIPSIYLASAIMCSLALAGCESEISAPSEELSGKDIKTITCTVPPIGSEEDFATGTIDFVEPETKGYLSGSSYLWSVGDRIGIVPTEGSQLYFEVEQGDVPTAAFDGGSWSLKTGHTFWAYYPLYPDMFMTKDKVSVSFDRQVQTGNNNNSHVGSYMCLYTDGTSTSTDALSFQFHHLTSFFKTYVAVPAGKYTKVEFKAPSAVFIKKGWFNVTSDSPAIVGSEFTDIIGVDLKDVEFSQETELTAYAVVAPVDISNIPITVTVFGEDGAYSYTLSKTSPMSIAVTYAFRAQSVSEAITSESAANSAFASGKTDVNFAAIDDADGVMDLVLPNTTSDVSISLPLSEADMEMNISYPASAVSYPDTIKYSGPATSDVSLDTPHSTVVLNGVSYGTVIARTAPNTIIVEEGVIVEELDVLQGSVTVYGTVDTIDLSDDEDASAVVHIYGTVDEILGEDDDDIIIWHNGNVPFEDANFKAYCVANFDTDGDGEISITEAEAVERIVVVTNNIESLGGVEYFINLKYLECTGSREETEYGYIMNSDGLLGTLDISQNKALTELICWGNQIRTLDASNLSSLKRLYCNDNNLQQLNVSGDVALQSLSCHINQLTSLDASGLPELTILYCNDNNLQQLNVSGDEALLSMDCRYNQLTSLDASGLPELTSLSCNDNNLQQLNVNGDNALRSLYCSNNQLTSLNLCSNAKLQVLLCNDNLLTSLDVSGNIELTNLFCPTMYTLDTLYVAPGQSIPNVTENRSEYNIPSSTEIVIKSTTLPQPEAIDLGLSVKWASFNVGASAPEEYGDYYAWGETEPYYTEGNSQTPGYGIWKEGISDGYDWPSYKWSNGTWDSLLKYNTESTSGLIDNKTVLDPEDDVAHVKLGGEWRMPTKEEIDELVDNCRWEWATLNGVRGRLLTSLKNGNSIFLPATGYRSGTTIFQVGSYVQMYSSSLFEDEYFDHASSYAYIYSNSGTGTTDCLRIFGLPVRAVQDNTDGPNMGDDVAGSLPGEFSVSETTYVNFSKGNLQATYNGADYTWGFAANQYDCIGSAAGNTTIGSSQTSGAVVDLFGWSTDGTNYGISLSTDNSDYSGDFVDWGKNIGDGSTWRTLSKDEWVYLFRTRTNASSLYKKGVTVCGKTDCLIIAPDGFAGTIATSYDTSTWPAAEAAGLVCLPAAGGREGSNVINDGEYGYYWSSSVNNEGYPYLTSFMSNFFTPDDFIDGRYYGISVRLVTESFVRD